MQKIFALLVVTSIAGCAATPNLEYKIPAADQEGYLKFTLPRSAIVLRNEQQTITATAVTDDSYSGAKEKSLMTRAMWSLWTSSTITKFEYVDGQNVIKSIATTAGSNASKIANIAETIVSSALSTDQDDVVAFADDVIDPFINSSGNSSESLLAGETLKCKLERNPGWDCEIRLGHRDSWVIPYDEFARLALNGEAKKVFPSSSCINARVKLTAPAAGGATRIEHFFAFELADPSYVNLTALRRDGELQASSPCRFNVTNDKAASNLDSEGFKEAIALVKALKK